MARQPRDMCPNADDEIGASYGKKNGGIESRTTILSISFDSNGAGKPHSALEPLVPSSVCGERTIDRYSLFLSFFSDSWSQGPGVSRAVPS